MLLYKVSDYNFWNWGVGEYLHNNRTPEQISIDKIQDILAELGLRYINNYNNWYREDRDYTKYAYHYFLITYNPLFMLAKIRLGL